VNRCSVLPAVERRRHRVRRAPNHQSVKEFDDAFQDRARRSSSRPRGPKDHRLAAFYRQIAVAMSMYWFQDIESARALARLYSESPQSRCGDDVPPRNPDHLPRPVAAAPFIDEHAMDDVAPGSHEDASETPCEARSQT
jgi:hypothetical protein